MPVYFLQNDAAGLIKIGHSGDPRQRMAVLQREVESPLRIVATFEGGLREEGRFHNLFRSHHSHGEWFHGCAEIDAVVSAISAGTFDISTIPDRSSWMRCEQAQSTWAKRRVRACAAHALTLA